MTHEIAATDSVAELVWLRREARRRFAGHPQAAALDAVLEGRLRALTGGCGGEEPRREAGAP